MYGLLALELPLRNKHDDPERGLAFSFLADPEYDTQERDYDQALQNHYDDGPPANWRESFVTAYAFIG